MDVREVLAKNGRRNSLDMPPHMHSRLSRQLAPAEELQPFRRETVPAASASVTGAGGEGGASTKCSKSFVV